MRRFLLPLLAALALPTAVNAEIDKETAEFCLKATDFAGCVETMSKDTLPPMQKNAAEEGLRTWTRDSGVIVRMRTSSVRATNPKGEYGRYLTWIYFRSNDYAEGGWQLSVDADCVDYTAKWKGGGMRSWKSLKSLEEFRKKNNAPWKYHSAKEAKTVMDEFCPQMNRLVLEAKERDRLNGIEEAKKKSSSGGIKVNCDSPVWKNKPRCN